MVSYALGWLLMHVEGQVVCEPRNFYLTLARSFACAAKARLAFLRRDVLHARQVPETFVCALEALLAKRNQVPFKLVVKFGLVRAEIDRAEENAFKTHDIVNFNGLV